MRTLVQDLRLSLRMLAHAPGFSIVAIAIMALGIGANTAIFSVVNSVLLRPLPYHEPDRLVSIFEQRPRENNLRGVVSSADFLDWREQSRSFDGMAATFEQAFTLLDREPELVQGLVVSPDFFEILGVKPQLGASFQMENEQPGKSLAAMISHGLWQRRFASNPGVIGRNINLGGVSVPVVGVLPASFELPTRGLDIFVPMPIRADSRTNRGSHFMAVVARLKQGVSLAEARTEMAGISRRIEAENPQINRGHSANVIDLRGSIAGRIQFGAMNATPMASALFFLLGAVALILLIACANLANMLLARAVHREKESSVRLALGASTGRIVRQHLTESVVLSGTAGVAALILSVWMISLLETIIPKDVNVLGLHRIPLDARVLGFTAAVSVLCGILFGVAPALHAIRRDLFDALKNGVRTASGGPRRQALRHALVIAEVSLALMLLAGAGLLLRSFLAVRGVDPGFRTERVLTMQVNLPSLAYRNDHKKLAFAQELLTRLRNLPGVEQAGFTSHLPASGNDSRMGFTVEGIPADPNEPRRAHWRIASPGYFETMRIALYRGRFFSEADGDPTRRVMIVNETAARKYWPGRDPVGTHARYNNTEEWAEVVGVVANVKHWGLEVEPRPEAYLCSLQTPWAQMDVVIRASGDPLRLAGPARAETRALDKNIPLGLIRTLDSVVESTLFSRRFSTLLLGAFAALAVVLAAAGVYGVMTYVVTQRTREIGVRITLGAGPGEIVRQVLVSGMRPVAVGILVGVVGAFSLTGLLASQLYGIEPRDAVTFVAAPLLLAFTAALAIVIPAWRATRVDPMVALRFE